MSTSLIDHLFCFTVTLGGAVLFLLFGFVYLYEAFRVSSEHHAIVPPDHEEAADLLHRF